LDKLQRLFSESGFCHSREHAGTDLVYEQSGHSVLSSGTVSPIFINTLKGISVLGLTGLNIILILPRISKLAGYWIMALPALKEAHKIKLNHFLQQFLGGLKPLHSFIRVVQFTGLTGLILLMDACTTGIHS
jgi:hypothetical protein